MKDKILATLQRHLIPNAYHRGLSIPRSALASVTHEILNSIDENEIVRKVLAEYLAQKHVRGGNIIHENLDYWLSTREE